MTLRWRAAFELISKTSRRIVGYEALRMLKASLDEKVKNPSLVSQAKAG